MGLGCGMNCCRLLLFVFNFVFWLLGMVVLGIGIWSRIEGNEPWDSFIKGNPQLTAANMMIAAGVIVTLIGFLGCCGAIKKSQCMLISYAVLIFLIFALELAAGIYAYTKRDVIKAEMEKGFNDAIKLSYGGPLEADKVLTTAVDEFQKQFNCCGSKAPDDWKQSKWYKDQKTKLHSVPESCCKTPEKDCNKDPNTGKIFTEGCVPQVEKTIKSTLSHMAKITAVAIAIAIIQLLGIVFACCLSNAIKDDVRQR